MLNPNRPLHLGISGWSPNSSTFCSAMLAATSSGGVSRWRLFAITNSCCGKGAYCSVLVHSRIG